MKHKKQIFIIILFIYIIIQLLLLYGGFWSISADESGHIMDAYNFHNGYGSFFGIWLPLQKLIWSMGLLIWNNLFWTPRIITLIFGQMSIVMLYLFSKELYGNKNALISMMLGVVYVGFVIFGVVPLMEIYFVFLLLLSLWLMLRYLKSDKGLMILIVSIILMTMTRYDGWVFAFFICSVVIVDKKQWFILLGLIFGVVWIIGNWIRSNDMLGFIHQVSARRIPIRFDENSVVTFFKLSILSGLIFGIKELYKRKNIFFIWIASLVLWIFITNIFNAYPTHNIWRVTIAWNILLIPFLVELIKKYKLAIAVVMVLFIVQSYYYINMPEIYTMTDDDIKVGAVVESMSGRFLMPNLHVAYMNVLVTCNNPDRIKHVKQITVKNIRGYDYLIYPAWVKLKSRIPLYRNNTWSVYNLK